MKRLMTLVVLCVLTVAASAQLSAWTGLLPSVDATSTFSGGDGSALNPFIINSANDLAQLSVNVNSGANLYSDLYFIQTNDLDLGGVYNPTTHSWSGTPWMPIGTAQSTYNPNVFKGHYDGQYHKIFNLYISNAGRSGLFGQIVGTAAARASVSNLWIMSGYVHQEAFFSVQTGAICGYSEYCDFNNCVNFANVYSPWVAGGIVGGAYEGTYITRCVNYGSIDTDTNKWAGGIAGTTEGLGISYCVNKGTITGGTYVGGIVSYLEYNQPVIEHCINIGLVSGLAQVGSIVGERRIYSKFGRVDTIGSIANCYYLSSSTLSGIGNWPDSNMTYALPLSQIEDGVMYSGLMGNGFTDQNWCFECEQVPMPLTIYPITINSLSDLVAFRDAVNAGPQGIYKTIPNSNGFQGYTIILNADIDMASQTNWQPIGTKAHPFKGQFIGLNHSIDHLNSNHSLVAGLFGYVDHALIARFHVTSGHVTRAAYAAGIVAVAHNSSIENVSNGASIASDSIMGGIVAHLSGTSTVRGCLNNGTLSSASMAACMGGLIGVIADTASVQIERSMNSALLVNHCSNAFLGGLVGYMTNVPSVAMNACFQVGQICASPLAHKYSLAPTTNLSIFTNCIVDEQMSLTSGQGLSLNSAQVNSWLYSQSMAMPELLNSAYWDQSQNLYPAPFTMNNVANAFATTSKVTLNQNPFEGADTVKSMFALSAAPSVQWYNKINNTPLSVGTHNLSEFSGDTIFLTAVAGNAAKECILIKQQQPLITISINELDSFCVNDELLLVTPNNIPQGFTGSWQYSFNHFVTYSTTTPQSVQLQDDGAEIRYQITDGTNLYNSNVVTLHVRRPIILQISDVQSICDNSPIELPQVQVSDSSADLSQLQWVIETADGSQYLYQQQPLANQSLKLFCTLPTQCGVVSSNKVYVWFNQQATIAPLASLTKVNLGDTLLLVAPQLTLNDVQFISSEWQVSNDQFNSWYLYNNQPVSAAMQGSHIRYAVQTSCGWVYSNPVEITLLSIPVIAELIQPAEVCDNEPLALEIPQINADAIIDEGWQISRTPDFKAVIHLSIDELNDAQYSGYYCRYFVTNQVGTAYSNAVELHMNISTSTITLVEQHTLQFVWNYSYQSIQWYHNGKAIEGADQPQLNVGGSLNGEYYVEVQTLDGRQVKTCPFETEGEGYKFKLLLVPNPVKDMEPFQAIIEGLSMELLQHSEMSIYSVSGILIYHLEGLQYANEVVLPAADYIVVVKTAKGNYQSAKLIVHNK